MSTLQDGVAHAMTANAFTSVSLDPPLVLVCEQQAVADRFARSGRDLYSQFDGIATEPGPKTECPLITGALSWLECRTWATYEGGDHTIVVGEVLSLGLGAPADGGALL